MSTLEPMTFSIKNDKITTVFIYLFYMLAQRLPFTKPPPIMLDLTLLQLVKVYMSLLRIEKRAQVARAIVGFTVITHPVRVSMYAICKELHPPTGVEHCVECHFFDLKSTSLAVASASLLRIYNLSSVRLLYALYLECILSVLICNEKPVWGYSEYLV